MCEFLQLNPPPAALNFQRVIITNDPIFHAPALTADNFFFSLITAAYQTEK